MTTGENEIVLALTDFYEDWGPLLGGFSTIKEFTETVLEWLELGRFAARLPMLVPISYPRSPLHKAIQSVWAKFHPKK